MAKVTLHDKPSDQIVAKALSEVTVVDSTGVEIVLKKPGVLAQYRLIEIVGESAKNEVYMAMVMPIIFVSSIKGVTVTQPMNKLQLEALIQRLDESGIEAVMNGVRQHFGAQDPDADKAALKK